MEPVPAELMDQITLNIAVNSCYTANVFPLINSPERTGDQSVATGNSTDCALLAYLLACGRDYGELRKQYPEESLVKVMPFDSYRKYMATVVKEDRGLRLLVKGAPEVILERYGIC